MGLPNDEEEERRSTNAWVAQLLGMLNARNRMAPPAAVGDAHRRHLCRARGAVPVARAGHRRAVALRPGDEPLGRAVADGLPADGLGAEEFARRNRRVTVAELDAIFRKPFVAGFKTGMDYAWSTESFGVLEALIKRRLRVNGYAKHLACQEGRTSTDGEE